MENIEELKKILLIVNPCAGQKKVNKYLTDIIGIFTEAGAITTVLTTIKRGDATVYAEKYAKDYDLVICAGGDGTFNETVSGIIKSGTRTELGYIPCGSTNDFAASLGLPKDVLKSAEVIVKGKPINFDIGSFNGRPFSYVASFGAFTKASYDTPQNVKNALGHLAYILGGLNSLAAIKPIHMIIEAEGRVYEDDYIFGAISNSTSIAGILTVSPDLVDLSDGLFELLLVRMPKNPLELTEIISKLLSQNYESDLITFVSASHFNIRSSSDVDWSLDGEYQAGVECIEVENLHNAISLVVTSKK